MAMDASIQNRIVADWPTELYGNRLMGVSQLDYSLITFAETRFVLILSICGLLQPKKITLENLRIQPQLTLSRPTASAAMR